jgi:hypothetical protein
MAERWLRMRADRWLGRYLGTAFLVVFAGSLLSGLLRKPILDSPTSAALRKIGEDPAQFRWSAMTELFITSVGIVALAVLLYTVVKTQNPALALGAVGWWIAEAVTLAISAIAVFVLVPVGEAYVEAGSSGSSDLLALGGTLVSFHDKAYDVHMAFFTMGGLVWYSLMYQSRCVPRWLSVSGVAVVFLSLVATVGSLAADLDLFFLAVLTGVFELVFGVWLVVKGVSLTEPDLHSTSSVSRGDPRESLGGC